MTFLTCRLVTPAAACEVLKVASLISCIKGLLLIDLFPHGQREELNCFKEYYEIVDEARPLSGYSPTHTDLYTEQCISNHKTKQASYFQK